MNFKRYRDYLQNDVEWLREAPTTWTVKRVGYFFNERREKVSDKDFQPLSVTKNGIVPQLETAAKSDDGDNRKKVCIGDFVINSRSDRKGSSGASPLNGSVSLINTVITPNKNIDIQFAHNLFRSTLFQEEYYRYGKGIVADLWSTNYSEMKNILIPVPPLNEQKIIASFLSSETSKIDTLITEQEKLIELLKEKRQAIISHAVTKGLDPRVKMKSTGVKWLGEVPEHWEATKVKNIGNIRYGIGEPPIYRDEGTRLIRATNVHAGKIFPKGLVHVDANDIPAQRIVWLKKGDIIVVRSGAYTGDSAIIPSEYENSIAGFDMVLRCVTANPGFIHYALLSNYLKNNQIDLEKSRAAQPHLNAEELGSCRVFLPPATEQNEIEEYLNKFCEVIDQLIDVSMSATNLLQERRSALISAAVTGQIDVRNYQSKEVG